MRWDAAVERGVRPGAPTHPYPLAATVARHTMAMSDGMHDVVSSMMYMRPGCICMGDFVSGECERASLMWLCPWHV